MSQANNQYQMVLQFALDAFIGMDDEGKITEWNPQAELIFGWEKQEVLGKKLSSTIIPTRFRKEHDQGLINANRTGMGRVLKNRLEMKGLRKNGEEFPTELTVIPITGDGHTSYYGFLRDLSAEKEITAERDKLLIEINSRRKLLEVMIKNVPIGIILLSAPDMIIEELSPYAEKYAPYKLERGKSILTHATTEDTQKLLSEYQEILNSGNTVHIKDMPIQFKDSDGTIKERYYTSSKIKTILPNGQEGILDIVLDTTEQVKRQQELESRVDERTKEIQKAYSFLNIVIENIPDMIFVKDAKTLRFVRFNRAGEELLGYSREELLGKNDYDFFPKDEADFFTSKDKEVIANKKLMDIPEESIRTKSGGTRILHTKKIPVLKQTGEAEYLLGISEDITIKVQAEEDHKRLILEQLARIEAEKNLKQRDEFLSIVSHELRTPLSALNLVIQLLIKQLNASKSPDDHVFDQLKEVLRKSEEQLGQFSQLVESLLDVSRISTGGLSIEKSTVNLSEIILKILKKYESIIEKAKCTITPSLTENIIGNWDPIRIEQIFSNLLNNATKFGAGNPIEISARVEENNAIISIKDHGIGISPEGQQRIFNRFERDVTARDFGGFGLGLYITRQLVSAHGGTIRVESLLGKGSTFIVELPLNT